MNCERILTRKRHMAGDFLSGRDWGVVVRHLGWGRKALRMYARRSYSLSSSKTQFLGFKYIVVGVLVVELYGDAV
jgi:hypothetical protein